jgi:hypothetical protein
MTNLKFVRPVRVFINFQDVLSSIESYEPLLNKMTVDTDWLLTEITTNEDNMFVITLVNKQNETKTMLASELSIPTWLNQPQVEEPEASLEVNPEA